MQSFLASPIWDGISGIIAIITVMVPLVTYLVRRFSFDRRVERVADARVGRPAISTKPHVTLQANEKQSGCARAFISMALGFAAWLVHGVMTLGLSASITMGSEEYRDMYAKALSKGWENFGSNFFLTCAATIITFFLLLLLLVVSLVVGVRWGYAMGAYATAIGSTVLFLFSAMYSKAIYGEYSLHVPSIVATLIALIFVTIIIWSTDLAIDRTKVLPAVLNAPNPGHQADG